MKKIINYINNNELLNGYIVDCPVFGIYWWKQLKVGQHVVYLDKNNLCDMIQYTHKEACKKFFNQR